jgi:glycosyltransferase involved in cell wall biosynthesis
MSPKPHILYIASWYPGKNAPALGNFIQQHARAASIENVISVVYASADKTKEEGKIEIEETHNGNLSEYRVYYGKINSPVPVLSKLRKREAYRNAIKTGIEAAEQKKGKAALLHVHVIWPAAVAVLPLLDKLNLPLVISEHWSGYLPEDGNYKGIIQKNISKRLADKARHITVVSQRLVEAMKAHGLGRSFSILPNAVDTTIFHSGEKISSGKTEIKLLHVSMLVDREKNISGLLRVMKELEVRPEISLEIIGDGPERTLFEEMAQQSGILNRSVFFRGFKTAEEIASAMQQADALIMFSNFEGMPVTIIEAQCCGLPAIATKVGYIPNMVNASQGILVEPQNESALKNAVLEFSQNRNSFDREKISAEAREKYSLVAVGQELNNLYASILEKNER